ncbi:hypothetical protein F4775DRAFT_547561 [Biscogniauxia sp. FL1348]|nr:hypothetical protein F4775DRAFT_547561 [Biscogniauxia sp. FL1348]
MVPIPHPSISLVTPPTAHFPLQHHSLTTLPMYCETIPLGSTASTRELQRPSDSKMALLRCDFTSAYQSSVQRHSNLHGSLDLMSGKPWSRWSSGTELWLTMVCFGNSACCRGDLLT